MSKFFLEDFVFGMILGKNWKYILADRLESDVDLRREEGLVSEGCRFVGTHTFQVQHGPWWVKTWHSRLSAECPRMSAGFLEELPLVRGCPRDSHLVTLKGTDLVRACPRGVQIALAASVLSALVRAVWKLVNLVCPFHWKFFFRNDSSAGQRHVSLLMASQGWNQHTEGGNVKKSKLACQNLRNSYNWLIH